jgi:protein phosphatase
MAIQTIKPNGETQVLQPAHTVRLKPDPELEQLPTNPGKKGKSATPSPIGTSIVWCGLTETGMVRNHNEDFFVCKDLKDATLFVVADGMGGHDAGEVASRLAAETVTREVEQGSAKNGDASTLLQQAVQNANTRVLREGTSKGSNMGTTLTLALVMREKAYIANVGDSRTYWIENGSIRRITTDHSLVEKLVSVGRLTKEEARNHPKSNVLYRNIGSETPIIVDTFEVPLKKGGNLLLCTDGLWGELPDEEIHRVFMTEKNAKRACTRLIELANESGGKDNITAIVVNVV